MPRDRRSWNDATTRPARLRVVNNSSHTVHALWVTEKGKEVSYSSLAPGDVHMQGTFTTHTWRFRQDDAKNGLVLLELVGPDATVELMDDAPPRVVPGMQRGIVPRDERPTPPEWGSYRQRGEAQGIPIMAWDCVADEAVFVAMHLVETMLHGTPARVKQRLAEAGADVAIIGRRQVVSDMPPHRSLRGAEAVGGGRTFDDGCRGVGGNWAIPTCSVGEENLLMLDEDKFHLENILVHEFGHSIMDLGLEGQPTFEDITRAYHSARRRRLYAKDCYMISNESEYWAEGCQSWFDATVRCDVNSGICSRALLKEHDPQLASVLFKTFGDRAWKYPQTAPKPWPAPLAPRERRPDRIWRPKQLTHAVAARLLRCFPCLPNSSAPSKTV